MMRSAFFIYILFIVHSFSFAQDNQKRGWWHDKIRDIHYRPAGDDFICVHAKLRFNRALYGTNTAFRVEAGDLPEFALYMPGMGGNFKFGLIGKGQSKWLIAAQTIKTIYRPGSMIYEIKDPLLGKGFLRITVLALADAEGMIIKTEFVNVDAKAELLWAYGGASGKKFSRDGDIGADPESSFYLQPDYCKDNYYKIEDNIFHLSYGTGKILTEEERYEIKQSPGKDSTTPNEKNPPKNLSGIVPALSSIHIVNANKQDNPIQLYASTGNSAPAIAGKMIIKNGTDYFLIQNTVSVADNSEVALSRIFDKAETAREKLVARVKLKTPDAYINTLGGALSMAADAIWEDPSYLHGAVAWRMRLNAWRGPYVADPLGWHDRARKHFSSYALSQVINPATGPVVADTALHLARQLEQIGTSLFSSGYISRNPNGDIRAHHYDMNLVFIDALLDHFNWTGDTAYVKEMWPLIKRHLAWEKRNFDADGDGLYDAYAAIWASDALQYSGGGVTHSSAYNYRANKTAAELARLIGEDGKPYQDEAGKIFSAVQKNLWLPEQGSYAEYKDLLGKQLIHPSPGLWTIYQPIDSKLPDAFQAYQSLRYVDDRIPHIPVKATNLPVKGLYLLSTTDWQPYTWSLNNVALAENLHTALAYWQDNRNEEAYRLWRSALIESMYLSASPGGFEQLSFYDAIRGELYRDFADPIGMAGRSLVEGLFGIQPNALHDSLTIQPGFPSQWNYASLKVPDIWFDFKRSGNTDHYIIKQFFQKTLHLKLLVNAPKDNITQVTVNGAIVKWTIISSPVGKPVLQINAPATTQYNIVIKWKGESIITSGYEYKITNEKRFHISLPAMKILQVYDPLENMDSIVLKDNKMTAKVTGNHLGSTTVFILVKQGIFSWWQPVFLNISPYLDFHNIFLPDREFIVGRKDSMDPVRLDDYFNDKVTNIFKHQYLSPRPKSPTLQLPTQGIGNWCYPLTTANIDDSGLRKRAGIENTIKSMENIPFSTPSDSLSKNIVFTSQWDNFPDSVQIPLTGKASQVYLLVAGSTNPMQSRITNGMVVVCYTDGTADTLLLDNPRNWWPIEQDYYIDGYAFITSWKDFPERLYLKEGKFAKGLPAYSSIKGFSNMAIDGGAATVLDMFLDENKTLQSLTVQAIANDVVIGLMAVTLVRSSHN